MHLPLRSPHPAPDTAALERNFGRDDIVWSRPVFKAPPLEAFLPDFDAAAITEELRRLGGNSR
jgi:hypothetical protein